MNEPRERKVTPEEVRELRIRIRSTKKNILATGTPMMTDGAGLFFTPAGQETTLLSGDVACSCPVSLAGLGLCEHVFRAALWTDRDAMLALLQEAKDAPLGVAVGTWKRSLGVRDEEEHAAERIVEPDAFSTNVETADGPFHDLGSLRARLQEFLDEGTRRSLTLTDTSSFVALAFDPALDVDTAYDVLPMAPRELAQRRSILAGDRELTRNILHAGWNSVILRAVLARPDVPLLTEVFGRGWFNTEIREGLFLHAEEVARSMPHDEITSMVTGLPQLRELGLRLLHAKIRQAAEIPPPEPSGSSR